MPKVKAHLRSLPCQEVGSALENVEASHASIPAKLCFRFLVLTAARSGEARGHYLGRDRSPRPVMANPAQADESRRGTSGTPEQTALVLLDEASALCDESGLLFPSPLKPGSPMSDMTLTKVLPFDRPAERATVHGFRSTSRTGHWSKRTPPGCIRGGACPTF